MPSAPACLDAVFPLGCIGIVLIGLGVIGILAAFQPALCAFLIYVGIGMCIVSTVTAKPWKKLPSKARRSLVGSCFGFTCGLVAMAFMVLSVCYFLLSASIQLAPLVGMIALAASACSVVVAFRMERGIIAYKAYTTTSTAATSAEGVTIGTTAESAAGGMPARSYSRCGICMSSCCLPFYFLFLLLGLWEAAMEAAFRMGNAPLGTIYQIDGQGIHIYCTGPSTASPTVVISHGQGGNSYEFEWVRRAPQLATARVCTNDRPGHGHSAPWASSRV